MPAIGFLHRTGAQHQDGLRLERLDERCPLVRAVGEDDSNVLGVGAETSLQKTYDADCSRAVGTAVRTVRQLLKRHLADAHHAPYVDHHFRMLKQKVEHLGIAIDYPR